VPAVVPRLTSLRDGVDLVSGSRICSGLVKATIEELHDPASLAIDVAGQPATGIDWFCVDPRVPAYEVNFGLPPAVAAGAAPVRFRIAGRLRMQAEIEITAEAIDRLGGLRK
jgi:hypothetical protein